MDPGRSMPIYPSTVNGIQLGMRNWPSFFVLAYKGYRASKLDSSIVQTAEMAGRLLNRWSDGRAGRQPICGNTADGSDQSQKVKLSVLATK